MAIALFKFFLSFTRIGWPLCVLWSFELRQYLPPDWERWLKMYEDTVFGWAIGGSVIWIALMVIHELPNWRDTYSRYLRPQVKFVVEKHEEMGQFTVIDNRWVLNGITVQLDGYFDNDGATPSMVKLMEVQLVKKCGIFKCVIGRKNNPVAFSERGKKVIIDHRGYYVGEFWTSPIIWGTGTCQHKEDSYQLDKLDTKYFVRLVWHVKGQKVQDTVIEPNWAIFKKDVQIETQKPIPDTSMPGNLAI